MYICIYVYTQQGDNKQNKRRHKLQRKGRERKRNNTVYVKPETTNIMEEEQIQEQISEEQEDRYQREETTFWMDFSIAERFGTAAIEDTYNRAMKQWAGHYKYLTELVLVLNGKLWDWYEKKDNTLARIYEDLYYKAREYALDNLKGEEFDFFYHHTD